MYAGILFFEGFEEGASCLAFPNRGASTPSVSKEMGASDVEPSTADKPEQIGIRFDSANEQNKASLGWREQAKIMNVRFVDSEGITVFKITEAEIDSEMGHWTLTMDRGALTWVDRRFP